MIIALRPLTASDAWFVGYANRANLIGGLRRKLRA
jgi:hypothetical protein